MDPITILVTALTLGAAAGLKSTAEQAVKDAYAGTKKLIQDQYERVSLSMLENDPADKSRQEIIKAELQNAGADHDEELLQTAIELIQIIQEKAPETTSDMDIDLGKINVATDIEVEDLHAEGDLSLQLDEAKSREGGFTLKGLKAGDVTDPKE